MTTNVGTELDRPPLIQALLDPGIHGPGVSRVELIETHISWVLLTGEFAYKLKKPLDLGFLDFSTLEKRRLACHEELRLNRRTAPSLYLDVVAITGSTQHPRLTPVTALAAGTPVLDYAVKMHEFPQSEQLDRRLKAGELGVSEMDAIGVGLARFHDSLPAAEPRTAWGEPRAVRRISDANLARLTVLEGEDRAALDALRAWSDREFASLESVLASRKRDGFVRECHGDLHLTNLAALEDGIAAFDCIEFNPELRWIDVISEVAFLMMDLQSRDRADLAYRFGNAYLEATGDYAALPLLRYYRVYRSLVRAKVAAIRLQQGHLAAAEYATKATRLQSHLELATRITGEAAPRLVITCGVSGSGKTWLSDRLLTRLPAFRVRADLERKRLFGLGPLEPSASGIDTGIYSESATRETYARLAELARIGVQAGYSIIVDGAFLKIGQRETMARLADQLDVPLVIVQCQAADLILEQRVRKRSAAAVDASEADLRVLAHQRRHADPLDEHERALAVRVDTGDEIDLERLCARVRGRSA